MENPYTARNAGWVRYTCINIVYGEEAEELDV
jgi:hypothetical protein